MIAKKIALVAHDRMKATLISWVGNNKTILKDNVIYTTGTTGRLLKESFPDLALHPLKSGPLGGDQQIGAMIAEGELGMLIFFTDPLSAMPHDVDVKALTRLSTLYNIPMACNPSTADFLIRSPLFSSDYKSLPLDFSTYQKRDLPV